MNFLVDNSAHFEHFNNINTLSSEKNPFSKFNSVSDIIYTGEETYLESLFFAFLDNVKRNNDSSKYRQFMMYFKTCIKLTKPTEEGIDIANYKEMKKKLKKVLSKIDLFLFAEHYKDVINEILAKKRQKYQEAFKNIMKILISARNKDKSHEKIIKFKSNDEVDKTPNEIITKDLTMNLEIYEEKTILINSSQKLALTNNYPESNTVYLFRNSTGNYRILYKEASSFNEEKAHLENEKKKLEKEKKKYEDEKKKFEEEKRKNEKEDQKKFKEEKKYMKVLNQKNEELSEIIEELHEKIRNFQIMFQQNLDKSEKSKQTKKLLLKFNNAVQSHLAIFLTAIDLKNNDEEIYILKQMESDILEMKENKRQFLSNKFKSPEDNFTRIHDFLSGRRRCFICTNCSMKTNMKEVDRVEITKINKNNEQFFQKMENQMNFFGIEQENLEVFSEREEQEKNDPFNCPPKRNPAQTNQENFVLISSNLSINQPNFQDLQDPFNCPVKRSPTETYQGNFVLIHSEAKIERDLQDNDPFNCPPKRKPEETMQENFVLISKRRENVSRHCCQ